MESIEQNLELNSIYCLCIINIFQKIRLDTLTFCIFLLKYPYLLKRLGIKEIGIRKASFLEKVNIQYSSKWNQETLNSLRVLYSKKLALINQNKEIIPGDIGKKCFREIMKYDEFDEDLKKIKSIKILFKKNKLNELLEMLNG